MKKQASKLLIIGPDHFFPLSSPELIFHIMKSWDQTSVLLSVQLALKDNVLTVAGYQSSDKTLPSATMAKIASLVFFGHHTFDLICII